MIYSSLHKAAFVGIALLAACYDSCAQSGTAKDALNEPQISIETKYVSISLKVDAELRRFGELFADCRAEGKAWFNKTNADTAAEWRDNRKAFRGLQWFYDRDYVLRSEVGRYVSVVRSDDWFDGGAHGGQHADTILWDNVAHKRTNIRAFFTETADSGPTMVTLAQLAKLAVAAAKLANDINGYGDDDRPDASDMTPEQEIEHDMFIRDGIRPALLEIGRGHACAVDRKWQELRPDLSLFALWRRSLCRRTVHRLCTLD